MGVGGTGPRIGDLETDGKKAESSILLRRVRHLIDIGQSSGERDRAVILREQSPSVHSFTCFKIISLSLNCSFVGI